MITLSSIKPTQVNIFNPTCRLSSISIFGPAGYQSRLCWGNIEVQPEAPSLTCRAFLGAPILKNYRRVSWWCKGWIWPFWFFHRSHLVIFEYTNVPISNNICNFYFTYIFTFLLCLERPCSKGTLIMRRRYRINLNLIRYSLTL